MLIQNLGVQTKSIMVFPEVAHLRTCLSFYYLQLVQEEKELKDVKTAVKGLVQIFKVATSDEPNVVLFKY